MRNLFRRKEKGTTYIITEVYLDTLDVVRERVIKTHHNFDDAKDYLGICREVHPKGNYYLVINHVN